MNWDLSLAAVDLPLSVALLADKPTKKSITKWFKYAEGKKHVERHRYKSAISLMKIDIVKKNR